MAGPERHRSAASLPAIRVRPLCNPSVPTAFLSRFGQCLEPSRWAAEPVAKRRAAPKCLRSETRPEIHLIGCSSHGRPWAPPRRSPGLVPVRIRGESRRRGQALELWTGDLEQILRVIEEGSSPVQMEASFAILRDRQNLQDLGLERGAQTLAFLDAVVLGGSFEFGQ